MTGASANGRDGPEPSPRILCLGLTEGALKALPAHVLEPGSPVRQLDIFALGSIDFRAPGAPELVISPLADAPLDAVEIAADLQRAGYRGRYIAVGHGLTDIALIEQEIRLAAPQLSFAAVALDGSTPLYGV
ncbi:MAG: hypothetical protein AAGF68_09315 [Pseudomonadota bacterium]